MMRFMLVLIFLTMTNGQNITDDTSSTSASMPQCSQLIENWQICLMRDVPRSSDAKMIKTKIDAIYDKCAGTMPKNCTSFWRAADECFNSELDKSNGNSDTNNSKRKIQQTLDQCFQRTPNDPLADLFEELYPEMQLFDDGNMKTQQQLNFGGRKFVPPPQCAPTMDNLQCVSKEMASLAQDVEVKKAAAVLRSMKRNCEEKLPSECTPQSPPLWMCVDRVLKQLASRTEESIQKCMQQKGFLVMMRQPVFSPQSNLFGFPSYPSFGQPQAMSGQMPFNTMPFMGMNSFQMQQPRMFDGNAFENNDWM